MNIKISILLFKGNRPERIRKGMSNVARRLVKRKRNHTQKLTYSNCLFVYQLPQKEEHATLFLLRPDVFSLPFS